MAFPVEWRGLLEAYTGVGGDGGVKRTTIAQGLSLRHYVLFRGACYPQCSPVCQLRLPAVSQTHFERLVFYQITITAKAPMQPFSHPRP